MIKFFDTHFDDYLQSQKQNNFHPELNKEISKLPKTIDTLNNMLFYGANGIGKYTQILRIIEKYSPSNLKYEKKINIISNKNPFCFKISDIHFEIDMALLGCNAKLLWHDIYNHIIDIVCVKPKNIGILLLKNFHKIHNELLDIFYSYMQLHLQSNAKLIFFIVTEHISFLPENILQICQLFPISKPNKIDKNYFNLKDQHFSPKPLTFVPTIYQTIIQELNKKQSIQLYKLRENIYDLLIYDVNISKFIWYLINYYANENVLKKEDLIDIHLYIKDFFLYYNNNYRPIYHIELLLIKIICKIHKIT